MRPFKVHRSHESGGRIITDEDTKQFWRSNGKCADYRGLYVFGRRAGKGITPGYVGKATKGLEREIFAPDKLNKYHRFLIQRKKGAPVFFFVLAPDRRGKVNLRQIAKVERYLVNLGFTANRNLINKHYTKIERWGIRGLIRGGQGKVARGTGEFVE
jgi:hypothetical protein